MVALEETIGYILNIIGISPSILKFPDFIFMLIIPFVLVVYTLYSFLNNLRIFRRSSFANGAIAVLISFVLLRFVYPLLFLISIGYLVIIKKARVPYTTRPTLNFILSIIYKLGILIAIAVLYLWVYPWLAELAVS